LGMDYFLGMAEASMADFPWRISSVIYIPFLLVFAMNFHTAYKLQKKIDQLDQLKDFDD